jgi:flagellar motor switch protein FliN/FliY
VADDKDDLLNSEEIEALFEAARAQSPAATADRTTTASEPSPLLQPDDISELIRQHSAGQRARQREQSHGPPAPPRPTDALLDQMEANLATAVGTQLPNGPGGAELESALPFDLREFELPAGDAADRMALQTLEDVELDVRIELGRAEMLIEDVLKLREGSVVPLDKLAGDPVDILVNGRLIARGEVLVLNDNFCVRVAEILNTES